MKTTNSPGFLDSSLTGRFCAVEALVQNEPWIVVSPTVKTYEEATKKPRSFSRTTVVTLWSTVCMNNL
jgi:hypothetical protein